MMVLLLDLWSSLVLGILYLSFGGIPFIFTTQYQLQVKTLPLVGRVLARLSDITDIQYHFAIRTRLLRRWPRRGSGYWHPDYRRTPLQASGDRTQRESPTRNSSYQWHDRSDLCSGRTVVIGRHRPSQCSLDYTHPRLIILWDRLDSRYEQHIYLPH